MTQHYYRQGSNRMTMLILSLTIVLGSCNEISSPAQGLTVAATGVKQPKMDIHTAILTNNLEVLKQHIAARSNLNVKDPLGGSSPLISACLFNRAEMAELLIKAGADLNMRNNDGSTALHTAAFFCRPDIVKMLLNSGADKSVKNKYGNTAYEIVAGRFSDVKGMYVTLGKMLEPMGLKLDFAYIEKTRPEIAAMLK